MAGNVRRILIGAGVTALAVSVFVLGRQNRSLKQANRDLVTRFTQPHRGLIVPSFRAASLSGDSVTIGQLKGDGRQVLFFFTTTCEYCRNSFATLATVDSAIANDTVLKPRLYAVGLDSIDALRRFADSTRFAFPILHLSDSRIAALYRLRGVPQLIVLDSGRVTYARAGELRGSAAFDSLMSGILWRPRLVGSTTSLVAQTSTATPVSSSLSQGVVMRFKKILTGLFASSLTVLLITGILSAVTPLPAQAQALLCEEPMNPCTLFQCEGWCDVNHPGYAEARCQGVSPNQCCNCYE
jgi:peroxiredoxin